MKIVLLLTIVLYGCVPNIFEPPTTNTTKSTAWYKEATQLADTRFNGNYVYSKYWVDSDGIDEINDYLSLTFDGTSKFTYWHRYKNYSSDRGWSTSPNFGSSAYSFTYEIKLEGSNFKIRLWHQSNEVDWRTGTFSFSNNVLYMSNLVGGTYYLTKR